MYFLAFGLSGCASVGDIRNVQVEIGNREWPPTRDLPKEMNLVGKLGDYTEISFLGEIYWGWGIHGGYKGWQGYDYSIFVPTGKSGIITNPNSPGDNYGVPMGFVRIDYENSTIDVHFVDFDDANRPRGLKEHALNGSYRMTPRKSK